MKITREIDYALRIMNRLAENCSMPVLNGINAPAISDATCVPVKFTLKILRKLKTDGLVQSFKESAEVFGYGKEAVGN